MAVSSTVSQIAYNGNDSTVTGYAIPFFFLDEAWITVYLTDPLGVITQLELGDDFAVTGAGDPDGGELTTTVAYDSDHSLDISRVVPLTQTLELDYNDRLPSSLIEQSLDKLTYIAQQLTTTTPEEIPLALVPSPATAPTLPSAAGRIAAPWIHFNSDTGDAEVFTDAQLAAVVSPLLGISDGAVAAKGFASAATAAARASLTPEAIGQPLVQLDKGTLWRGTAETAGAWTPVQLVNPNHAGQSDLVGRRTVYATRADSFITPQCRADDGAAVINTDEVIHPSVLFFPGGFADTGWEWIMACTPYPEGDDQYENPSILVSRDGTVWAEGLGLAQNPLVAPPSGAAYLADPCLFDMHDGRLGLAYMAVNSAATTQVLNIITTTDLVNWTSPVLLMTASISGGAGTAISPAIARDSDGLWHLWAINAANVPPRIEHYTTADIDAPDWTVGGVACVLTGLPSGMHPWQGEVRHVNGRWIGAYCCALSSSLAKVVFLMTSTDGEAWDVITAPLVNGSSDRVGTGAYDCNLEYKTGLVWNVHPPRAYRSHRNDIPAPDVWSMSVAEVRDVLTPPVLPLLFEFDSASGLTLSGSDVTAADFLTRQGSLAATVTGTPTSDVDGVNFTSGERLELLIAAATNPKLVPTGPFNVAARFTLNVLPGADLTLFSYCGFYLEYYHTDVSLRIYIDGDGYSVPLGFRFVAGTDYRVAAGVTPGLDCVHVFINGYYQRFTRAFVVPTFENATIGNTTASTLDMTVRSVRWSLGALDRDQLRALQESL